MKNKNPLYVVKGKEVQEASSVFDLVIKKFNLEPSVTILKNLFYFLMEQIENWAMFQAVKKILEQIVTKIQMMGQRMGVFQV